MEQSQKLRSAQVPVYVVVCVAKDRPFTTVGAVYLSEELVRAEVERLRDANPNNAAYYCDRAIEVPVAPDVQTDQLDLPLDDVSE